MPLLQTHKSRTGELGRLPYIEIALQLRSPQKRTGVSLGAEVARRIASAAAARPSERCWSVTASFVEGLLEISVMLPRLRSKPAAADHSGYPKPLNDTHQLRISLWQRSVLLRLFGHE